MLDQLSGRYLRVAAGLAGVCAVIALVGLADQFGAGDAGADSLLEKKGGSVTMSAAEVRRLEGIMVKQEQMEGREQKLLEGIERGESHAARVLEAKKVVHAAAAHKVQAAKQASTKAVAPNPTQLPARPVMQSASLAIVSKVGGLGGGAKAPTAQLQAAAPAPEDANEKKIEALKAKLAKVEAAEAATKKARAKAKKHIAAAKAAAPKAAAAPAPAAAPAAPKAATPKAAAAPAANPITGKDFLKLTDKVAITKDSSIAKAAGLQSMGCMGSGKCVDEMLRKLDCDPTSFVCSGTPAQKKQAAAIVKTIMERVQNDATEVNAYGWKEEHALPPAPHM